MKLSDKLHAIANADCFYGEALYSAYELDKVVTKKDKYMLHRYMHGAELTTDRFRLQILAIKLAEMGS